jgi:hypothetical protein
MKIYTLEKVLKLKKDTVTQTVFLDEAMKVRNGMRAFNKKVVLICLLGSRK